MYRLNYAIGIWYGIKIENIEEDMENIGHFLEEGTTVLLTVDLEAAADDLGIKVEDIRIVQKYEGEEDE